MPKVRVCFHLSGKDLNFDEISRYLELEPTFVRGEEQWPEASKQAGLADDLWCLYTSMDKSKSVSEQFDKMQNNLFSKKEKIIEICKKNCLESSFEIRIEMAHNDPPEIVLSRENLRFISAINAEIGFDLYID